MRIVNKKATEDFKRTHADSAKSIDSWQNETTNAQWQNPMEMRARYPKADTPGGGNAIFNIAGNKYRLWVRIAYKTGVVYVVKIGTHKEYDGWVIR